MDNQRDNGIPPVQHQSTRSRELPLLRVLAKVSLAIAVREAAAEELEDRAARLANGEKAANAAPSIVDA